MSNIDAEKIKLEQDSAFRNQEKSKQRSAIDTTRCSEAKRQF